MQKGIKTILGIGGLIAGAFIYSKISAGRKLEFYPKKLSLIGKKVKDMKLVYTMEIVNPSFTTLKINNVFINIYDRTNQLGRVIVTTPIIVPPNSTTDLNLPVKLNLGTAVYFFYEVIAKGIRKMTLAGSINSEGLTIPISQEIDLSY